MSSSDGDPAGPTAETGSLADSSGDSLVRAVIGATHRSPPTTFVPGQLLDDTYRIVRTLGAGGMGVVYLARDQKLGRDVAIKLHAVGSTPRGVERLMREASAIAQLSHVNVVTVYQVDAFERRPFVVMEYVDGGTARTWLQAQPRTWREIVALYVKAGRGLAAAHAAGLVHRDFKPDNVLVGKDGRVRVADFGLVQGSVPSDSGEREPDVGETVDDGRLTRSGSVMGTPAYMAPEQHHARAIGAAADQFAFCVALWEALDGARPFDGATRAALLEAIEAGKLRAPSREVPRHVRRALVRGLSADPAARFPTMDALLHALDADPGARRKQLAAAAGAIVLAGGAITAYALTRDDPEASCRAGGSLTGLWDDARRAAVEQAFLATGKAHAADTFTHTAAQLDRYAGAWSGARIEACRATHVRHEQTAQLLDLRYACLDRRRAKLDALVDLFAAGPDPKLLDGAVRAVQALDGMEACGDAAAMTGMPARPTDPHARTELARIEQEVAEAEALITAGRFDDALAKATPAVAAARAAGYAPALSNALRMLAGAQNGVGDHGAAKETIREAARAGGEAHDDKQVAAGWIFLSHILINSTNELDAAEQLLPVIEAAVARAGAPPGLRISQDANLGALRAAQGRYAEARAPLERAAEIAERELPDDDATLSSTLNRLANTLARLGDNAGARAYLERTIKMQREALGPEHPYLAMSMHNLAGVIFNLGDYEGALDMYQRSLAIKEKVLGPDHRDCANTLSNLGVTLRNLGRFREARPYLERAAKIAEATYGPDSPNTARAQLNVAGVVGSLGSFDEAIPMFERALAVYEQAVGKDHPELVPTLIELGNIKDSVGDTAGARALLERALAIQEATVGHDHPDTAAAVASLADLLVDEGKLDEALAMYEDARAITVAALGEAHPQVAKVESAMGFLEIQTRDWKAARRWFTTALPRFEAAYGPEHREIARALFGLAQVDLQEHEDEEAQTLLERSIEIIEKASGADYPGLADPLTSLMKAHLYQGHAKEAIAAGERAVKLQERDADPKVKAETAFVLAQARWLEGTDRKAALADARAARAALAATGVPAKDLAELDRWLRNPQK